MGWKRMGSVLLLVLWTLMIAGGAAAQDIRVEWDAWNAQITAYANSDQLDVAETQVINVLGGTLRAGSREYSQPVEIENVFLAVNGGQPQALTPGNGPGQFRVLNEGETVILEYQLPAPAAAGDSFVVQINYSVEALNPGLIDWYVVPGGHGAPVNSSTVTLNFPEGQMPDPSFVRMIETNGTVTTSGSSIVVQSNGVIPADQAFGIQVPYGANVGAGAEPGASNPVSPVQPAQPPQPAPTGGSDGGLGNLLPILCILGVVLLLGGGNLLRGLLGGGLGGGQPGGGILGGGSPPRRSNPLGGLGRGSSGGSGRGFRPSANQNRNVPTVRSDKRRGGGASFK